MRPNQLDATPVYNTGDVQGPQLGFITEEEIGALAIIDAGHLAVALGSISNINKLMSMLEDKKHISPLVIT